MNFQKVWNIDYSLQIGGALRGGIEFVAKTMAVYRFYSAGSWTSRKDNLEAKKKLDKKRIEMLRTLNTVTNGLYQELINKRLKK